MLSDIFKDAKGLMADIFLEDVTREHLCTITNFQQALKFETKKSRPLSYEIVFRTLDGCVLCIHHVTKKDSKLEIYNKNNNGNIG